MADTVGMDMAERKWRTPGACRTENTGEACPKGTRTQGRTHPSDLPAEVGGWGGGKTARARVGIRSLADAGRAKSTIGVWK